MDRLPDVAGGLTYWFVYASNTVALLCSCGLAGLLYVLRRHARLPLRVAGVFADLASTLWRKMHPPDPQGEAMEGRNSLTRWGLLLNALGGVLLLVCHFPFTLPSGYPQSITDAFYGPWAHFWQWANLVGSVAGAALTVWGIYLQYRAIANSK